MEQKATRPRVERGGGGGGGGCGGSGGGGGGAGELVERLPQALTVEIMARLDLESLCSAAPVCRALRVSVSLALSSISSLDLSAGSLGARRDTGRETSSREIMRRWMSSFRLTAEERRGRLEMGLPKTKDIVASSPVVIFSSTYCPLCGRVKQLLTDQGATFKVIELDEESDGPAMHSALVKLTGQSTCPNVFIGGKHVGGHNFVMARHREGKLLPLLVEAGAIAAPAPAPAPSSAD